MSSFILNEPTRILLPDDSDRIKKFLTYDDKGVNYLIHRLKTNASYGHSEWATERIAQLKSEQKKCLLEYDLDGRPYTLSGLSYDLTHVFHIPIQNNIIYPEPKALPWHTMPKFELRPYQKDAVEALLKIKHGAIELCTGSGKTQVIQQLIKELGLKSLVIAPLSSIALQIYDQFKEAFGPSKVGMYGDGKKVTNKLITVGVAQSLTKLVQGNKHYEDLQKCQILISDESHTIPAESFKIIALDICSKAPYRFFVSATQTRIDGSEMLLKGITGPVIYRKEFKELVNLGYLAKPYFKIFSVPGEMSNSKDPRIESQQQLLYNPRVNQMAADIADKALNLAGRQVLILIEEFKQFAMLRNYLNVPFEFIHGGVSEEGRNHVPQEYWQCDKEAAIKRFNAGETKVLIGTSAVSTGVDLRPVGCLIYLQGGKSEIKVKQAIGRGTRITDTKKDFWVVDFRITSSPMMQRHLEARLDIYSDLGEIEEFDG